MVEVANSFGLVTKLSKVKMQVHAHFGVIIVYFLFVSIAKTITFNKQDVKDRKLPFSM